MGFTSAVTHVGLCAGYGGIELGLKRAIPDLRTVALCEIEAFAISNLVAKMEAGLMDPAPIWPNLKTFPWEAFRDRVDILTGGYPCQPFSAAGQRKGKQDPRHLWPWIADGIRLLRPRICFFENVEGHISLGLSDVIEDLAGMGYRTTWGIFSASEVGAPHQRKRVFILAVSSGFRGAAGISGSLAGNEGQPGESDDGGGEAAWPSRPGEQQYGWEPPRVVADSHGIDRSAPAEGREHDRQAGQAGEELGDTSCEQDRGLQQSGVQADAASTSPELGDAVKSRRDSRDKSEQFIQVACRGCGENNATDSGQAQPTLGGYSDGPPSGLDYAELCVACDNRTYELRLLGNGVVPATAERAFRLLIQELL